jgi:hypothetical protein
MFGSEPAPGSTRAGWIKFIPVTVTGRAAGSRQAGSIRASVTTKLGLSIFDQAKSVEIPYSTVRRKAERLWPLWA